jgi:hypothetical protein
MEEGGDGCFGHVDLGGDADAGEARPVLVVEAGLVADAGDGVAGADAEVREGLGGVELGGRVPAAGIADGGELAAIFKDGAEGFSRGEEREQKDEGGGDGAQRFEVRGPRFEVFGRRGASRRG